MNTHRLPAPNPHLACEWPAFGGTMPRALKVSSLAVKIFGDKSMESFSPGFTSAPIDILVTWI